MTTDSTSGSPYSSSPYSSSYSSGSTAVGSSSDSTTSSRTPTSSSDTDAKPAKVRDPNARVTDKPVGALALAVLRVVVALIMLAHGVQKLRDMEATKALFKTTVLPSPELLAQVTAWSEVGIAAALVLGLAVRLAGLGVVIIAVGALVTVKLKDGLFPDGVSGFAGELELLLAAAGVVLLLLGGGAWGLDKFFRRINQRGMSAIKS